MVLVHLPTLNAILNAAAALLLTVGWVAIRRGRRTAHVRAMLAATVTSAAFLVSYLTYHFVVVPEVGHTKFHGGEGLRIAYYTLLIVHVLLAVVNLPMVALTLIQAARGDWERHRRIARPTWAVWMVVSVTGVLVYLALYRWNPVVE